MASMNLQCELAPADDLAPRDLNAPKARIVYLVRREGLTSVFASQVARRMGAVADAGFDVDVGVFTPAGQWARKHLREKWNRTLNSLPASLQGRVWRLPSLPSRVDWPMAEARVLRWWLKRFEGRGVRGEGRSQRNGAGRGTGLIIQCRNATVTRMALWARRGLPGAKVIFDCRGVVDHEFLYERGLTFETAPENLRREAERLGNEQREAAQQSDAVFCVSERMAEYLVREYGIAREKCVVVPCCVDYELFAAAAGRREEMRRRLGFDGKLVVCYCGSLARYQLPRESLQLYRQVRDLRPDAHFFAITTDPAAMRSETKKAGIADSEVTIVSVAPHEVPEYLVAADVGLLLREQCVVNEVAAPIKFGEYLASGVPVIISEGIGDYSDFVRQCELGEVLLPGTPALAPEQLEFITHFAASGATYRKRCLEAAEQHLNLDSHLPAFASVCVELSDGRSVTGVTAR